MITARAVPTDARGNSQRLVPFRGAAQKRPDMPARCQHQSHLPVCGRKEHLLHVSLVAIFMDTQRIRQHQGICQHPTKSRIPMRSSLVRFSI